jgi:hypothetical protein
MAVAQVAAAGIQEGQALRRKVTLEHLVLLNLVMVLAAVVEVVEHQPLTRTVG